MTTPLAKILRLRKGVPFVPDDSFRNRYTVAAAEPGGGRTFYCFSRPIRDEVTGKLFDPSFCREGDAVAVKGGAVRVRLDRTGAELCDRFIVCRIGFAIPHATPVQISEHRMLCGRTVLTPTGYGLCVEAPSGKKGFSFSLATDRPQAQLGDNPKCFALLREPHIPYLTVSCIGAINAEGHVTAPARISYDRDADGRYLLRIGREGKAGGRVRFEINLYAPKLLRDTTVESRHPGENNAFGGEAFPGRTEAFGEQWLYLTPDTGKLPDPGCRPIRRVLLHFARHNAAPCRLRACRVAERFCSFGATWNSRKAESKALPPPAEEDGDLCVDVTDLLTDENGRLCPSDGLILRGEGQRRFAAIGTGDSYVSPVVLEIRCGSPDGRLM